FDLVEVNSSFYAIPEVATVMRWAEVTPDDFIFDYKLHKLLSRHSAEIESLPPELRDRAETSPRGRVKLTPELEAAMVDATIVAVDAPPGDHVPIIPPIDAGTRDDLAYLRCHGRNTEGYLKGKSVAERFGWEYSDEELEEIKQRAETMAEEAVSVHVAFNNNR